MKFCEDIVWVGTALLRGGLQIAAGTLPSSDGRLTWRLVALEHPNMAKMHIFNCEAVGESWPAGLGLLGQAMMLVGLGFQEFASSSEKPA